MELAASLEQAVDLVILATRALLALAATLGTVDSPASADILAIQASRDSQD